MTYEITWEWLDVEGTINAKNLVEKPAKSFMWISELLAHVFNWLLFVIVVHAEVYFYDRLCIINRAE